MRLRIALFVIALATMVAALVVTIQRGNDADDQLIRRPDSSSTESTSSPSPSATAQPTSADTPEPSLPDATSVLTDVDVAAGLRPGDLVSVVVGALDGVLADTWEGSLWRDRMQAALEAGAPITVGRASISPDNLVQIDVLISHVASDDQLELRLLPAASALGDIGLEVDVELDGSAIVAEVDRDGARLLVPSTPQRRHQLRVRLSYEVAERTAIIDDGSPAGFGLLAASPGVIALGHWLPLVTLETDSGPMQQRGDVGGFPAGVISMVVQHPGELVSSGVDGACPSAVDIGGAGCTWARGVGLRDLSAAVITDPAVSAAGSARMVVPVGSVSSARLDASANEAAAELAYLNGELGDLPWPVIDVVGVPIRPGAAGMEFPGMVWIDPEVWPQDDAGFGSYVLAHELGHQWFHALVGSSSLTAPVIDEATTQYVSYLAFVDRFGQVSADAMAARQFEGRWQRALAAGVPDDAPALPMDEFSSARSYGSAVYGRGGQAWVNAEQATSRAEVLDLLRALVTEFGLGEVTLDSLLATAALVAPAISELLVTEWQIQ